MNILDPQSIELPGARTQIVGEVAMVFGERAVFLGLVQVVPKHLPAMPLRGNLDKPRTALLKLGCLRVMTVELVVLFCRRRRLYRLRIKMSRDSFVILGCTSLWM